MTLVEGENQCAGCGISETDAILLCVNIPPLIYKQDLCPQCLKIAIDASKKKPRYK